MRHVVATTCPTFDRSDMSSNTGNEIVGVRGTVERLNVHLDKSSPDAVAADVRKAVGASLVSDVAPIDINVVVANAEAIKASSVRGASVQCEITSCSLHRCTLLVVAAPRTSVMAVVVQGTNPDDEDAIIVINAALLPSLIEAYEVSLAEEQKKNDVLNATVTKFKLRLKEEQTRANQRTVFAI